MANFLQLDSILGITVSSLLLCDWEPGDGREVVQVVNGEALIVVYGKMRDGAGIRGEPVSWLCKLHSLGYV
jgi:hypothetical protein